MPKGLTTFEILEQKIINFLGCFFGKLKVILRLTDLYLQLAKCHLKIKLCKKKYYLVKAKPKYQ